MSFQVRGLQGLRLQRLLRVFGLLGFRALGSRVCRGVCCLAWSLGPLILSPLNPELSSVLNYQNLSFLQGPYTVYIRVHSKNLLKSRLWHLCWRFFC